MRKVVIFAFDGAPACFLHALLNLQDMRDRGFSACAGQMGVLEPAKASGLKLLDEMAGHPSMARYLEAGCELVTL